MVVTRSQSKAALQSKQNTESTAQVIDLPEEEMKHFQSFCGKKSMQPVQQLVQQYKSIYLTPRIYRNFLVKSNSAVYRVEDFYKWLETVPGTDNKSASPQQPTDTQRNTRLETIIKSTFYDTNVLMEHANTIFEGQIVQWHLEHPEVKTDKGHIFETLNELIMEILRRHMNHFATLSGKTQIEYYMTALMPIYIKYWKLFNRADLGWPKRFPIVAIAKSLEFAWDYGIREALCLLAHSHPELMTDDCHPIVSSTGKYFGVVNREELKKIPELCVIFKKYSKYLD